MCGVILITLLSGCGSSVKDVDEIGASEGRTLSDIKWSASLSVEDLDIISEELFPKSYSYTEYNDGVLVNSGEFIYGDDMDRSLLLPIHAAVSSRNISSSNLEDGMIYTLVDIVLVDSAEGTILYINDPESLRYVAASVEVDGSTLLYAFRY